MKRLKIFAWTAAALITLNGCENNFDPEIYGSLFPGNFLSTAFGTSASIRRPAKLRFRFLLRNTVFMASSILESSTISSIILSSLHMIIKSAFNSPGRASSKKSSYQTPLPCALFFPFPTVNGCCWRGSFLLAPRRGHVPTVVRQSLRLMRFFFILIVCKANTDVRVRVR